jgi:hypothetical protein
MVGSEKTVQRPLLTRQQCNGSRRASTKVCLLEDSWSITRVLMAGYDADPPKRMPDFWLLAGCRRGMAVAQTSQLGRPA